MSLTARWSEISRKDWDAACAATPAALQQDWCYGEAIEAIGGRTARAQILRDGETIGLAQFITRRFAGLLSLAVCTRGPVWLQPLSLEDQARAIRALKASTPIARPRFLIVSPDAERRLAGTGGLTRVMTGFSTVMLDLEQSLEALRAGQHGKWRNRLVAAEKAEAAGDFKISQGGVKPAQYAWLIRTEEGQRAARGYQATPGELIPAFMAAKKEKNAMLLLRADQGKEAIAAMMFLIHGAAATYHIGFSNEAGRKAGAHNLLLWRGMEMLKQRGVRQLDLGGVNTQSGAGIARFKIGSGGRVTTLAGSFV